MDIKRLVFWITMLAVFAMAARLSVDTDTWWHLRSGEWIIENRSIPSTDPFSHTLPDAPWEYPGWLMQVPMALVFRGFGPGGLNILTALMVAFAFLFVWRTSSGGEFLRAFAVILAAAASAVFWAARPYLATFLLAAVFLWILDGFRWDPSEKTKSRLRWLPMLMLIWVNSHGGFMAGFLIWGVYWFADLVLLVRKRALLPAIKRVVHSPRKILTDAEMTLTWIGFLLLVAVCINPFGPVMLAYPFKTISIGALQDYIQEWQSPNFHMRNMQPFAWLLLLALGIFGISRNRLALTDYLLLGGFGYMSLMAARNIALFSLVAAPVLTRYSAPFLDDFENKLGRRGARRPGRRFLNWLILGLLAFAVLVRVILVLPNSANQAELEKSLPVSAVEFIKDSRPAGNLYNSYNWGGYLLYTLQEYPVFIDGRTDLYAGVVIDEWVAVMRLDDDWEQILDKYGVNLILIETGAALDRVLERENGWLNIYRDELAVVYVRP